MLLWCLVVVPLELGGRVVSLIHVCVSLLRVVGTRGYIPPTSPPRRARNIS